MNGNRASAICALLCAASVALGAYASHAADPQDRQRLALAASFAFAHALAVMVMVMARRDTSLARAARIALLAGVALFSGSLASAALLGTSTAAAPLGGILLLTGWLLAAIDYFRAS